MSDTMLATPTTEQAADGHALAWHERRRSVIGGSETPVLVMGNDYPFDTSPHDIWESKVSKSQKRDEPNAAMKRGTIMEPIIANLYAEKYPGLDVLEEPAHLVHPEHACIGGNIDRWLVDRHTGERGVLEIKCPGIRTFMKCKREGPQLYYQIQLQHYLEVTGASYGAFAIFNPDLWELLTFDMERDKEWGRIIVDTDTAFWRDYVLTNTPPTVASPFTEKLPEVDCGSRFVRFTTDEWQEAIENLRAAKELKEESETLEAEAKATIQMIMDEAKANVAEGAGARIYWKEQAGKKTLDSKALEKAHPELNLAEFMKIGKPSKAFRAYYLKKEAEVA